MTKVAQIEDRGAAVAWSPISEHADVIALGAKDSGSTGFDDYGGELELFDLGITSSAEPTVLGSVKTTSRFSSIGWTPGTSALASNPEFSMGLIAGGMDNGTVNIWNPSKIVSGSQALLSTIERKSGAISALQFNPHAASANLLATGSSTGEILISSLDNPDQPTVTIPSDAHPGSGAEITQMAWNTEVAHIVASAAGNGVVTIWDLKQNKPWCELRAEASGSPLADVCWNPTNGMHLITASSDDRNPILKLWDLRASMSMPLATMEGHTQGVLGMNWCPHDDSLLLSCGKDNRTILWDVHTLQPIADLPNDESSQRINPQGSSQDLYAASSPSGLSSSQQKRYDVQWSPLRKGVVTTCSFDRKVQAHSVLSAATKSGRTPKWMKPASGVSCGFGGSIVSFGTEHKVVTIGEQVEQPELKAAVEGFEATTATGDFVGFAAAKAVKSADAGDIIEAQLWGFMQIIFDPNARQYLLQYLGFDSEEIAKKASEFKQDEADISNLSLTSKPTPPISKDAEETVNQALLVGNFEAAVECCIRSGNLADALVLASCGGAELWAKTQAHYFASEIEKRPFLSVVSAVIHNKLGDFVNSSDPKNWHETLAVICTYSNEEEYRTLCESLGDHLEKSGDAASASVCFMCAMNLDKASKFWLKQLQQANSEEVGEDSLALHEFAVKVAVFMKAGGPNTEVPENVADILFKYAKVVSEQGLFSSASKYCQSNSQDCKELKDRLYRSKDSQQCVVAMGSTPDFPYQYVNVGVAPKVAKPQKASNPGAQSRPGIETSRTTKSSMGNGYSTNKVYNGNAQRQTASHQGNGQYAAAAQPAKQTYSQEGNGQYTAAAQPATQPYSQQGNAQYTAAAQSANQQYSQQGNGQYAAAAATQPVSQSQQVNGQYAPAAEPTTQSNEAELPPGWMALQDPASGKTYFANQATGETTWEQPAVPTQVQTVSPQRTLASKYGDGFVTSASHPQLAAQYGNVGTSNPYTDASRPGTAVFNKVRKPPVSGTFNVKKLTEVADSTQYKTVIDGLLASVTTLSGLPLGPSEKRQLAEVQKGVAIFSKRLANGDIGRDVAGKVEEIVTAMNNKNYAAASTTHTSLVNSDWKEHKDWLKGLKFLIQMSSKAFQSSRRQDQWAM